ncbi:flavin reductase family protein [Methylobacterium sp. J-030]|uniref:flavin reductase family protein n=1 Tax=Methylobacterium sp. J-030 TaxID=2836627 RepID=UPI001FBB695C|nr:flavin reductase family protein [Methylobacterium sp. J-030]
MRATADAGTAPHDLPSVSETAFKTAMRALASTVCVITSRHSGEANGMTATAVSSVAADPPTVLVAVNRDNRSHALIRDGACFALNILCSDQHELALQFATRALQPFATVAFSEGVTGCPLIDGCGTVLECALTSSFDVATHTIFIGRVVASRGSGGSPLLYWDGQFGTVR